MPNAQTRRKRRIDGRSLAVATIRRVDGDDELSPRRHDVVVAAMAASMRARYAEDPQP
jgi:hypothetical protein